MHTIKLKVIALQENSYHVFLTVKLEGITCRFLLDTGASQTVIDRGFAIRKFGKRKVKTIRKEVAGLHSVVNETSMITIKKFFIGHCLIRHHLFAATDLSHVNKTYRKLGKSKIHGILGSDILLKTKAIINYGNSTLTVTSGS